MLLIRSASDAGTDCHFQQKCGLSNAPLQRMNLANENITEKRQIDYSFRVIPTAGVGT
jgi:hypothetical protein